MAKIKRQLMAHFINAAVAPAVNYILLGDDLEEYNVEMNANVETTQNILGNSVTKLDSYAPQVSVEPYYASTGDALSTRLQTIADQRLTLDDLKTTVLEVHLWEEVSPGVFTAWREDAIIEVVSTGGNTTGYQIPFNVYYVGNRVRGKFTAATKTFVPDSGVLGLLLIELIAGTDETKTKVSDVIGDAGGSLLYKVGTSLTPPQYGDSTTGYSALTLNTDITTAAGQFIIVVKAVTSQIVAASVVTPVIVGEDA